MPILTIFFIAIGLSADAFAASITNGLSTKKLKIRHPILCGLFFGGFQAIMPAIGFFAGIKLENFIKNIDHWIAFILLSAIGIKMIFEAYEKKSQEIICEKDSFCIKNLTYLAIATSIDALVIGISFAFLKIDIILPIIIIGVTTFILSFVGVIIGNKIGHFFEKKAYIAGGSILVLIGLKILIEHLFF